MDISKQLKKAMSKPAPDEKYFSEKYPESVGNEMKRQTQKQKILNHLKNVGPINPIMALELFGCFRLAARIDELKKSGLPIKKRMVTNKHNVCFAEYTLEA